MPNNNNFIITLTIAKFILLNLLLNVYCQCNVPRTPNKRVEVLCFNLRSVTSGIIVSENGYLSSSLRYDLLEDPCIESAGAIIVRCKIGYQNQKSKGEDILNICKSGKWKYEMKDIDNCEPTCGKFAKSQSELTSIPLLYKGIEADIELAPWHVALYRNISNKFEQICGGSIVHSNIIVSAAHCVYDDSYGKIYDPLNFSVGAGKRFRQYEADEALSQFARVKEIHVPETFLRHPLRSDIAVLVLDRHLQYNSAVAPVCLDWDNSDASNHYQNLLATLYGWGHTSSKGVPSSKLLKIELRTIENDNCKNLVDRNHLFQFSNDRFCAINRGNGTVCQGDSGGGLLTDNQGFKLTGVVSEGFNSHLYCSEGFTAVFTKVRIFHDFLKRVISQSRNKEQNLQNLKL